MATFSVDTVFKAIDKMSAPMRRMERSVGGLQSRVQVAEAKMARGFRRITRAVGTLGIALGATALLSVAGDAVSVFKNFEQANANVASVLGVTSKQTKRLQVDAKRLGSTTQFTATQVAELQKEYAKLGFSQNEILDSAEATLYLAQATETDLGQAAKQTGATLKAFGFETKEAGRVAGVLGVSTTMAALDMEFFATAMSKVAPIAKTAGFSLEETSALFASLADSGFDASTAATSTKNILLMAADANSKLAKAMGGPVKSLPELVEGFNRVRDSGADLSEMLNLTDSRSVAAFATFISGGDKMLKFSKSLESPEELLRKMAFAMGDTLTGSTLRLQSAYEGFILSIEDGNGGIGKTIRSVIDLAGEMLSLAGGFAASDDELTEHQKTIRTYASIANTTLKIVLGLTAAYVGYKTIMTIISAVQAVYNTVQAVSLALQGKTLLFLKGNTAAMVAYKVITATVTAATWLWTTAQTAINTVIMANPIGALIAAIAILIGLIVLAVKNFDSFGSILLFLLGPIGMLVNAFMIMKKNWQSITDAFKGEGIIAGLKRIGIVLLDTLLYPLQQALELASNIPGLGDLATKGAERIVELRERLDLVNPEAERESAREQRQVGRDNANVDVTVRDETGRAQVSSQGITPNLTPTFQ